MARRRTKKRTHVGAQNGAPGTAKAVSASQVSRSPKSMVIRIGAGEVGPSVSQLVKDVRRMMEPETASRLKERRSNRLRDYVTMAGPLGVSHLMLFSRSESGNTNLRMALTPRGPTLHFRVDQYSLCKDVKKALKHPKGGGKEYLSPPLLVMNNFISPPSESSTDSKANIPRHLEQLTTTIFQSLFPPISPQATPLSSIRRVLLVNRETTADGSYILNLRHYAITTKATGLSRPIRRLNAAEKLLHAQSVSKGRKTGLPNLGKLDDIADYMIGGENGEGYMTDATSGSEVDTDAEIEVLESTTRKVLSNKGRQQARQRAAGEKGENSTLGVEKRAVKLVELGPRLKLRMTKVEEGVCTGKVMWHEYISKTKEEVKEMDKVWEQRRTEKAERKRVQKENVERKKKSKEPKADEDEDEDGEEYDDMDVDEWDSEGLEGDGEMELNEEMDKKGEWEEEEEEIAAG
ncbi:MAG: hypothetical protein M1818_004501 [Claussenomyces sp. TS43310]|nr:MAG: hypothetical protein M1818_004501 [Claussenomyces sp. TS43310]